MSKVKLSPFFPLSDVGCKCGCGQAIIHEKLYAKLLMARGRAAIPFNVLSWNRCKAHNTNIKGSRTSSHLTGWAIDIACIDSMQRFKIVKELLGAGFTRIGIYSWGIHIDCDPSKTEEVLWLG